MYLLTSKGIPLAYNGRYLQFDCSLQALQLYASYIAKHIPSISFVEVSGNDTVDLKKADKVYEVGIEVILAIRNMKGTAEYNTFRTFAHERIITDQNLGEEKLGLAQLFASK